MLGLGAALAALALGGCATTAYGPGPSEPEPGVVDLSTADINMINKGMVTSSRRIHVDRNKADQLRPGDKIQVRVFDSGEDGTLDKSKQIDLGVFQIDGYGYLTLPYAGRLRASKMTVATLQSLIARKMKGTAVSPQVSVTIVETVPTSFTSFGAFKNPGEFKFTPGDLTLGQALARSGGLQDQRIRPEKLYVYRQEPAELAVRVGGIKPENARRGTLAQVVYQVDLTNSRSFFYMQQFQMKKGDMLYVPDSGNSDGGPPRMQPPPVSDPAN